MEYRAEATSLTGFVQQIACCYLRHGYWFYVTGHIPAGKDPRAIDHKLIQKYGIAMSDSTRARRKRLGQANLQYLRHDRRFVILATKGQQPFFEIESKSIHDMRHVPLKYGGYSISCRRGGRTRSGERDPKWHAHVEIERRHYLELKARFLEMATHRSLDHLALAFYQLPLSRMLPSAGNSSTSGVLLTALAAWPGFNHCPSRSCRSGDVSYVRSASNDFSP